MESLDWSDDESDYVLKPTPVIEAETKDEFDDYATKISDKPKENHIIDPIALAKSVHSGTIKLDPIKGQLPREIEDKLMSSIYPPEVPYLPYHAKETLGKDLIVDIWKEFLAFGADESEMVMYSALKEILIVLSSRHPNLPLNEISFKVDDDDYIEFKQFIESLVSKLNRPGCRECNAKYPDRLVTCCCRHSCVSLNEHKEMDPLKEKYYANFHRLNIIFTQWLVNRNGKVRIKHIPDILQEADIPFDTNRKENATHFWENRGELYINSIDELITIVDEIRTDKEESLNESIETLKLPLWIRREFSTPEILMYRHRFKLADTDNIDFLNPQKLKNLIENLGQKISISDATHLVHCHDLNGSNMINFEVFMVLLFKIQNNALELKSAMEDDDSDSVDDRTRSNTVGSLFILEQVVRESKLQCRLYEEIADIEESGMDCVTIRKYGGTPITCECVLDGPAGTVYEGGEFTLLVTFDVSYPYVAPICKFLTRIIAPNVISQINGDGVIPHIKDVWDATWGVRRLFAHILGFLVEPNLNLLPEAMRYILEVVLCERPGAGGASGDKLRDVGEDSKEAEEEEEEGSRPQEHLTEEEVGNIVSSLNRMEQLHVNLCHQYLHNRNVFDSKARQFVEQFAS